MIWISRILVAIAGLVAGYLAWASISAGPIAGCDGGSGCEQVLTSRWAYIAGIPVSVGAVGVYLALLVMSFPGRSRQGRFELGQRAQRAIWMLALVVVGSVIWFVSLQLFVIKGFCKFCMTSHAAGLVGAVLMLVIVLRSGGHPTLGSALSKRWVWGTLGIGLVGCFVLAQIYLPQPARHQVFTIDSSATLVSDDLYQSTSEAAGSPERAEDGTDVLAIGEAQRKARDSVVPSPKPAAAPEPAAEAETEQGVAVPSESGGEIGLSSDSGAKADTENSAPVETYQAAPAETVKKKKPLAFALHGGRFKFRSDHVPVIGDPYAEKAVVNLFDYSCSHCREYHAIIERIKHRFAGRLSFVMLPVPLNSRCNPYINPSRRPDTGNCDYARLALAVWLADASQFEIFDSWLASKQSPAASPDRKGVDLARAYAEKLVGRESLAQALSNPWIENQLRMDADIYGANREHTGKGGLPQQVFGSFINVGSIKMDWDLILMIDLYLGLKPEES